MTRYLIFNFDGTRNGQDDAYPTNIQQIHKALKHRHKSFYFEGPGNDEKNMLDYLFGGAFGFGCLETLDTALAIFERHHKVGDKTIVTGFSRGAATARKFCHELSKKDKSVAFLGCFDTVYAMLPFGRFQQKPLFSDLHVSPLVKRACHALSLDEDREPFTPNLMNARPGVEEVWFEGNHSDVGGGYKESGLADRALGWMVNQFPEALLTVDALPPKQPLNKPHREDMRVPRAARRIGVMEDDKWTTLEAVRHCHLKRLRSE